MHNNRRYYLKQYIYWKCQNLFRWIELIMCVVCLSLAIVVYSTVLHIVTKILLLVVATCFLFITFLDVVSWCQLRPIGYRTWIMVAIAAFLMFWLCGGFLLLVKRRTYKILLICTCIFNLLTGLIYLLDCFRLIKVYIAWISGSKIVPARSSVDKSVSTCFLFEVNDLECPKMKRRKNRHAVTVKSKVASTTTTSYGGTFPVSRDLTPLPSPQTTGGRKDSGNPYRKKESTTASQQLSIHELSQDMNIQSHEILGPEKSVILEENRESKSTQTYDSIKKKSLTIHNQKIFDILYNPNSFKENENIVSTRFKNTFSPYENNIKLKEENDLYSIPNSFKKTMFHSRRPRRPFDSLNKENIKPQIIQRLCTELDHNSLEYIELKSTIIEKTKKEIMSTKIELPPIVLRYKPSYVINNDITKVD